MRAGEWNMRMKSTIWCRKVKRCGYGMSRWIRCRFIMTTCCAFLQNSQCRWVCMEWPIAHSTTGRTIVFSHVCRWNTSRRKEICFIWTFRRWSSFIISFVSTASLYPQISECPALTVSSLALPSIMRWVGNILWIRDSVKSLCTIRQDGMCWPCARTRGLKMRAGRNTWW